MDFPDLKATGFLGGVIVVLGVMWAVVILLVHLAFATAVYQDAERNLRPQGRLQFVNPFTWALSVLVASVAGVALYWAIHHSTLRAPATDSSPRG